MGITLTIAMLMVAVTPGEAKADQVDRFVEQLASSSDYKVRLSAALNLAKVADPRAIPAFISALGDSDKTVRGVAAASLAKLVDSSTKPALRKKASDALKRTATNDDVKFVRSQAQKAYDAIAKLGAGGSSGAAAGIYVDLGEMSAKTDDSVKLRGVMRKTVEKTIGKKAQGMSTTWPSGKKPSKKELSSAKSEGYHVDGTLTEMTEQSKGSSTIVSCKISMLIATYPEKSMFGFLNGGASVQAGSSAQDIAYAKEDCVAAVVEDLVAKKIIPTINTRAGK